MDIQHLISGLQGHPGFRSNPAAERFHESGHPGRARGHEHRDEGHGPHAPRALGLLNRQLLANLGDRLATGGTGLPQFASADYSPEAVADRVLGFVHGALAGVEDAELRAQRLEQALAGVEQGLAEARDALAGLGVQAGAITDDIDRTEALIREGLSRLAEPAPVGSVSGFQSLEVRTQQSSAIEITTRDGDRVTIHLSQASREYRGTAHAENAGGSAFRLEAESSRSASLSFQVEGSLDADERKAIDSLLHRLDRISDRFFEGDVRGALGRIGKLELDTRELAGFSLDLSASASVQAVSAYQVTAGGQDAVSPVQQLGGFLGQLRDVLQDAGAALFAQPRKAMGELFNGMVDAKAGVTGVEDGNESDERNLLKALVGQLQEESVTGAEQATDKPQESAVAA